MSKKLILFFLVLSWFSSPAQEDLGLLLTSGIRDTRTFAGNYIRPGVEGVIFNRSSGWYQTAEVKDFLGFEFSVIGNASINLEEYQTFVLNVEDYQNLQFRDGSAGRSVPTILGHSNPPSEVLINYQTSSGTEQTNFLLPQGLGSSEVEVIPTYFLQARLGIFKGTEIKARYFPARNFNNVDIDLFGGAIQHEFTSWLPAPNAFPVAISGMVAYSVMDASYDFTEENLLEGANQRLDSEMDFWLFAAIVSTKMRVVNFYAGAAYVDGSSKTEMLGTYSIVDKSSGEAIVSLTDPLLIPYEVTGLKANLGMSLQLGFFKLNAEYNFQEYETVSAGFHIGF